MSDKFMIDFGHGVASGKIILMGEHSVVYGKPAIALPFKQAQISSKVFKTNDKITIDSFYHKGYLDDAPDTLYGIKQLIYIVLVYLKQPFHGIHIQVESSLPPQRGLGSSASVSIAIVRSLFDAFKVELSQERLNYFVDVAEQIHHVNPSGLDAITIAFGQAVFYQKDLGKTLIPLKMDAVIVVADTGKKGLTKEAVQEVKQLWTDNPTIVSPIMDRLEELTNEVRTYLETNEIIRLGLAMTEAHQLLRSIKVSDDLLEKLVEVSLLNGALGAKLTGSGKGGCIIALAQNEDQGIRIADALKNAGAVNTWLYDLKEIVL